MDKKPIKLRKKSLALITGASQRLGRELALGFAREGYAIGLHYYKSRFEAEETAGAIRSLGSTAILLQADLRDPCQIQNIVEQITQDEYQLKVLINSASVIKAQDITRTTIEDWDSIINLNLRAPWLLSVEAAKMMGTIGGSIINITDTGTGKVWPTYGAYLVSKSALEMLTKLLARSMAPGIRVNAIAPGLILPSRDMDAEDWENLIERVPLKKCGLPENIVDAALYLARSEYITGEILVVDGGFRLV
jgi:NAD(P)-dependent dehydrogenase (short-subunit alcohol dehydrogenase family)